MNFFQLIRSDGKGIVFYCCFYEYGAGLWSIAEAGGGRFVVYESRYNEYSCRNFVNNLKIEPWADIKCNSCNKNVFTKQDLVDLWIGESHGIYLLGGIPALAIYYKNKFNTEVEFV